MEVPRFLVILIFLITEVKSTNTLRISISDRKANWTNAGKICQMIRPTDFVGINRTRLYQGQPQSEYAWINASVTFTPWTLYHGCFVVKRAFIKNVLAIPDNKDHLLFCIKHCNETKYLGMKDSRCVCFEIDVIDSDGGTYVDHICKSTPCTFDKYVICGSFKYDTAYAVYEIVTLNTRIDGFYNCLSAHVHNDHTFTFEASDCEMNKNRICHEDTKEDDKSPILDVDSNLDKGNWTSSNVACNLPYTKRHFEFIPLPARQYWTAYFRRSEENDFSVENPEYCLAAKVGPDGSLSKKIRKCNEKLHVLCNETGQHSRNISNNIPVIEDKPALDVKSRTDDRIHNDDSESKDNKNQPSSVDTAGNNETDEKQIILIIVSVVSTDITISMIVCIVRWKVIGTKASDQTASELSAMMDINTNATNPPQNDSLSANNQPAISDMMTRLEHKSEPLDESQYCTIDDAAYVNANTSKEQSIIELDGDGYVRSKTSVTIHEYTQRNIQCFKDANQTTSAIPALLNVTTNATNSNKDNSLGTNNQTAVCDKNNQKKDTLDESQDEPVDNAANENANMSGERDIIELDGAEYVRPTARVTIHEYSQLKVRRTIDAKQTECKMPALLNVNTNATTCHQHNSLCTNNQPAYYNAKHQMEHTRQPFVESEYETVENDANENANTSGEQSIIELDRAGYVRPIAGDRVPIYKYTQL